jgi:hypothetical protein
MEFRQNIFSRNISRYSPGPKLANGKMISQNLMQPVGCKRGDSGQVGITAANCQEEKVASNSEVLCLFIYKEVILVLTFLRRPGKSCLLKDVEIKTVRERATFR